MKNHLKKIAILPILSLLLFTSCPEVDEDQAQVLLSKLIKCAQDLEICEQGCAPTEAERALLVQCQLDCINNNDTSAFCLGENCYNQVWGKNTPDNCKKGCKESYYECVFGPDWEEVIK